VHTLCSLIFAISTYNFAFSHKSLVALQLDMDRLVEATNDKYVLAGRNSAVDTNVATASSVIGSILGVVETMQSSRDLSELTFTVQGCGKVGSTVAKELVRLGAKHVQTCDLYPEAANIEGCTPITDWAGTKCDFLVPCANSLAITEDVAMNFPEGIKYCVGATNSPFANKKAKDIFDARGVMHIPESISSAGAILADSVEVRITIYFALLYLLRNLLTSSLLLTHSTFP
jgi:leucine dehydrogenase